VTSLAQLSWPTAAARGAGETILAVPLGATEQHGPHLPLTTDTEIAVALVDALARRRPDVVQAPAVPYGSSGEHAGFPGTVSIGQDALERLLIELCRSASESFARIVLVCAHGGNAGPLVRAVSTLRREGRSVLPWWPAWGGDAHAGHAETSIMLALAPDRVHLEVAARGASEPIERLLPRLRRDGVRAVSPNGVLGDPQGACAPDGQRLLAGAVADLIATVSGWEP
jgi:mycofactocin system creatininase family protein